MIYRHKRHSYPNSLLECHYATGKYVLRAQMYLIVVVVVVVVVAAVAVAAVVPDRGEVFAVYLYLVIFEQYCPY